jgi:hypothetical protein
MKNYIEELRKRSEKGEPELRELADYLNDRLIKTNKTIFEYVPIDGLKKGKQHLYDIIDKLRKEGFFDGN